VKIVAYVNENEVLCSMNISELSNIIDENCSNSETFAKKTGFKTSYSNSIQYASEVSKSVGSKFPISSIYMSAKETLTAYSELKTKFESIKNQLNVLLGKMETLKQKEETKK
jgi:hypothetical protein